MIIKKWNGSAWVGQAIETTAQSIFTSIGGTALFDSNNKLKPAYLPDSVFDTLFFYSTFTVAGNQASQNPILADVLAGAIDDATNKGRSAVGYYWVASTAGTIYEMTGIQGPLSTKYVTMTFTIKDSSTSGGNSVVEVGDWFLVESVTGAGTSLDPYVFKLTSISNTYDLATSGVAGIVKISGTPTNGSTDTAITSDWAFDHAGSTGNGAHVPAAGTAGQFLKHDGTWGTPSYTTVSVASGTNNGTIKTVINGTTTDNIAVTGLGSAAYTASSAYATASHSHGNLSSAGVLTDTPSAITTGDSILVRDVTPGLLTSTTITFDTTQTTYLRRDGTWATPTDTNTTAITSAAGTSTSGTDKISFLTKESAAITAAKYTTLVAGSNVAFNVGTAGQVTISATDTNTTYTAGDGLTLTGTDFDVDYPVYYADDLSGVTAEKANAIGFEW